VQALAYPLRIERYELREDTGGAGMPSRRDGVIRSRRTVEQDVPRRSLTAGACRPRAARPQVRAQLAADGGGGVRELPGQASLTLHAGDTVAVETPGGGWGGAER
jgi:N-methylhydantoinase B